MSVWDNHVKLVDGMVLRDLETGQKQEDNLPERTMSEGS